MSSAPAVSRKQQEQMSLARRGRLWLALIPIVVIGGYLVFKGEKPPAAPAAAPVETVLELGAGDIAVAASGDIGRVLRANGSLRAQNQAVVRAKVAGEIVELTLHEGDRVALGQVLARIENTDYESRLKERIAALEAARSQAALSEATRRKNQDLVTKGFISPLAYDNTKGASDIAAAQVRQQEAQLDMARKALADTVVRSPINGWVAERAVQRGDKTNVDGKLFTLVDLSRLELEALVPASEIAAVAVGQPFATSVEGYGERRFEGRVARIGPSTQSGNRYLPIYIELSNADGALKTGLFAEGTLQLQRVKATALIPGTALRNEGGSNFVYLIEGERLVRRPVEVGLSNEGEGVVDVLKGVVPGARVIAANLGNLKDGAPVRVKADGKAKGAP